MERITIKDLCGTDVVTRDHGKVLLEKLEAGWLTADRFEIDFGNILIASVSFVDEVFGTLAAKHPPSELKAKLSLVNIEEFDRHLVNDVLRSRLRQKELSQQGNQQPSLA